jgi:hypothetical protein
MLEGDANNNAQREA